jgi:hypothetical protein
MGYQTLVDILGHYIYSATKCLLWLKVSRKEKEDTVSNAVINAQLPLILLWGNVTLIKHTSAIRIPCIACMQQSALLRVVPE